jgi:DNA invertase Pin-like site-specific DNA recombinase
MSALIYIQSTNSDNRELQLEICEKTCTEKGLVIRKVIDNINIEDVISNQIQSGETLVISSFSSLSSKQLISHRLYAELSNKSCGLISVSESFDSRENASLFGLHAWVQENEANGLDWKSMIPSSC